MSFELGPLDVLRLRGLDVACDAFERQINRLPKEGYVGYSLGAALTATDSKFDPYLLLLIGENERLSMEVKQAQLRNECLRMLNRNLEHGWKVIWRRVVIGLLALYVALDLAGYFILGRIL